MTDRAATVARFATDFLAWIGDVWANQKVLVRPTPASRPRVSRWGTYYSGAYAQFLKDAPEAFSDAFDGLSADPGPVCLLLEHVAKRPTKTVRLVPGGDVDNHAKSTLDVLQKVKFLLNDDLVDVLVITKRWTLENDDEEQHIRTAGFRLPAGGGQAPDGARPSPEPEQPDPTRGLAPGSLAEAIASL